MEVTAAQREVRSVYRGGFFGQLVSAGVWVAAATVGTLGSSQRAALVLFLGGCLIFPLTTLFLRLSGRRARLSPENPLGGLAMQVAFVVPLTFPVVLGAMAHRDTWFFPSCLVVVGAHYLPFVFLYGLRLFAVLAGAMIFTGLAIGLYVPDASFALGGWIGAVLMGVFACVGRALVHREEST